MVVGGFGAISYYGDTILRPFAHTFGIWILLVAVVSARQSLLRGTIRGGAALPLSVVAFFYSKQIYYDILYPGPGFPYRGSRPNCCSWSSRTRRRSRSRRRRLPDRPVVSAPDWAQYMFRI